MATRRHDTGPPEDAIEMLRADHQKVRDLFQDYEETQDHKAKRKIAQQVFVELETHAQLEESVFYPAFKQEADQEGKQLVAESLEELEPGVQEDATEFRLEADTGRGQRVGHTGSEIEPTLPIERGPQRVGAVASR